MSAGLGRRLVSTHVCRRRHAAGIGGQCRVPNRPDRATPACAFRRRRPGAFTTCHGDGRRFPGARGWRPAAVRAALRQSGIKPGCNKGNLPGVRQNDGQCAPPRCVAQWRARSGATASVPGNVFAMPKPVKRAAKRAGAHAFNVEPHVLAVDIHSGPLRVRRGGWIGYTGAAVWWYCAGFESILGLSRRCERLHMAPASRCACPASGSATATAPPRTPSGSRTGKQSRAASPTSLWPACGWNAPSKASRCAAMGSATTARLSWGQPSPGRVAASARRRYCANPAL